MNIALRKLAMIERNIEEQEERAKIDGYVSCPVDAEFKEKISRLMEQVRVY